MNIYLDLFLTFAKVGVMTFGGGYAMLPILQREVVENKGWATEEELMDYFAIGQCRDHSGSSVPVPAHHFSAGQCDRGVLSHRVGAACLWRHPCLRLCPDLQRGGKTV